MFLAAKVVAIPIGRFTDEDRAQILDYLTEKLSKY